MCARTIRTSPPRRRKTSPDDGSSASRPLRPFTRRPAHDDPQQVTQHSVGMGRIWHRIAVVSVGRLRRVAASRRRGVASQVSPFTRENAQRDEHRRDIHRHEEKIRTPRYSTWRVVAPLHLSISIASLFSYVHTIHLFNCFLAMKLNSFPKFSNTEINAIKVSCNFAS